MKALITITFFIFLMAEVSAQEKWEIINYGIPIIDYPNCTVSYNSDGSVSFKTYLTTPDPPLDPKLVVYWKSTLTVPTTVRNLISGNFSLLGDSTLLGVQIGFGISHDGENWAFVFGTSKGDTMFPGQSTYLTWDMTNLTKYGVSLDSVKAITIIIQLLTSKPEYTWATVKMWNLGYSSVTGIKNPHKREDFQLSQNFPNPFNPTTTIQYQLPKAGNVTIRVYDILGNEVATLVNGEKPAGVYETKFNASNLSSGLYIYQLKAGNFMQTKKMMLLK